MHCQYKEWWFDRLEALPVAPNLLFGFVTATKAAFRTLGSLGLQARGDLLVDGTTPVVFLPGWRHLFSLTHPVQIAGDDCLSSMALRAAHVGREDRSQYSYRQLKKMS